MIDPLPDLETRIEDYEEAIATFARLHEELTELRENITLPEADQRVRAMLKLNAETLEAIKHSLTLCMAVRRTRRSRELVPLTQ
jgi:hypothetical protein